MCVYVLVLACIILATQALNCPQISSLYFFFQSFKLFFSEYTNHLISEQFNNVNTLKFDQSASVAGQHTAFQSLPQVVAFSLKYAHTLIDSHGAIALWTKIL